jgi:hypothetical protein
MDRESGKQFDRACDPPPGADIGRRLPEPLRQALVDAVSQLTRHGPRDAQGVASLKACGRQARGNSVKAEHLVMALHALWESGPGARLFTGGRSDPALTMLIDVTLDAYFAAD